MIRRRWLLLAGLSAVGALALSASFDRWKEWRALLVAPSVARFPVRGIDVSHHQGPIDWRRVKAAGQSFAFIKATEGADFRDRRFLDNWHGARAQGLVTGAYHFFTFCSPGAAQAENFLAVAPRGEGDLPLAVDIEFAGNCTAWESLASIQRELRVFVAHLESSERRPPLLYTTLDSLGELIPTDLHGYSYWIRSLWGEPGVPVRWLFWQHSSIGEVPGVRGPVDLNVFRDSPLAWRELVAGSGAPELGR